MNALTYSSMAVARIRANRRQYLSLVIGIFLAIFLVTTLFLAAQGFLLAKLAEMEAAGLKLLFVDGRPDGCTAGEVVALDAVAEAVRAAGGTDVALAEAFPLLRTAHYQREGADVFMLVNESMSESFDGVIRLPVRGVGQRVELLQDGVYRVDARAGEVHVKLACSWT